MTLGRRVVLATALCGLVGFIVGPVVLRAARREGVERLHEPLASYVYQRYEKARCEANPESWSMSLDHDARAYAYDADTLTSRNPSAPPLDRGVWGRLTRRATPRVAFDAHRLTMSSRVLIYRGADSGPCAIVQTTWPPQTLGATLATSAPLGLLLAALFGVAIGFVVVARPVERVERRRRELQRHLADVSHDLKTPISSLHLALEQAAEANRDPDVKPFLAAAMNDAVYLSALTTNLRLASEMREGWTPAPDATANLTEIVERVVMRTRFFAKQRDIELDVAVPDEPSLAACDPVAAEQAIANVVQNAVTHGEPGGHIAVVLEAGRHTFALTITDDGPGVAPIELPHLGERTFRSDDARQRDPHGSGLGLAITNEVCKRCGWTLTIQARTPRGLEVVISGASARDRNGRETR